MAMQTGLNCNLMQKTSDYGTMKDAILDRNTQIPMALEKPLTAHRIEDIYFTTVKSYQRHEFSWKWDVVAGVAAFSIGVAIMVTAIYTKSAATAVVGTFAQAILVGGYFFGKASGKSEVLNSMHKKDFLTTNDSR